MWLKSVRAQLFRNIVDSGSVSIEDDVTCLVGKNESGKTALLSAIYRFNPVYEEDQFVVSRHYPRWRLAKDRRIGSLEEAQPISCSFELDDDDVAAVTAVLGEGVIEKQTFTQQVTYAGKASSTVVVDERAALENAFAAANAPEALRAALGDTVDLAEVATVLSALEAPESGFTAEDIQALHSACTQRLGGTESTWQRAAQILKARVPKFFYFGQYQTLPGRIDVRELGGQDEPGATAIQTARSLLALADTTADALTEEDFEDRKAELEAVSNELTAEVLEFWKQNEELSVEIDLDKVTERNQMGQSAVARFLEVRVKDKRHGFTNNFDQRSSGFQWFFSFLAAFSQFEAYEHGVVVLLDEPALTLHGRAQADFLRFIDERLASVTQVVYTTHSPFMVDPARLNRVRIVEDRGPAEGAVVTSDVLGVGDDSLFPLEAALGYDIAQNLFVGADNLLVEGTSDFTYLTMMSDHLQSLGRAHLNERWRVLPAGGATNVPTFVALLGRALQVTVLIDGSPSGVSKLKTLANSGLLNSKRLLITDQFTGGVSPSDIEDLFSPDEYLALYNTAFTTNFKAKDLTGSDRIIARLGRAAGETFKEHGRPAEVLLRTRDKVLPTLSESTLSRFEHLFQAINGTLT